MTALEQWLEDATAGLSPASAARVREEIQEHYDSARESGSDAIAALGDPGAANRAYRKVLLTEQEAMMAPVLTRTQRPSFQNVLLSAAIMAALVGLTAGKQQGPGTWPIMIAIFCTSPITWFFTVNTLERSRAYLYIHGARGILVLAVAWWYQGWMSALILGALLLFFEYFTSYRRVAIFQKLSAGQIYDVLPGEPQLTHLEAIHLRTLKHGSPYENVAVAVLFLILGAASYMAPATFLPMTICLAIGYVAQRTVGVYTEEGSRWFRVGKWITMAMAAMLPALLGARSPWIGALYLGFLFWLFDLRSISLRRKLPAAEWPPRLYW